MKKYAVVFVVLGLLVGASGAWAEGEGGSKGSTAKGGAQWFSPGPGYRGFPPYEPCPHPVMPPPPRYRDFPPGIYPYPYPYPVPPPIYRWTPPRPYPRPRPIVPPPPIYRRHPHPRGPREYELLMQLMMMGIMIDQNRYRDGGYDGY